MRRTRFLPLGLGLLTLTLLALAPPARTQQGDNGGPVEIVTGDYVTLKGFFYPGNRGKASPTVLLLHAMNEDSNKAEWIGLAKALNAKGYAVLRFDFRGHGESTTVNPGKPNINPNLAMPGFWDKAENKGFKGASKRPSTIDAKMFPKGYLPMLANDIVAAKAWLDTQDCDSGNLVLIGAREGATLGALWLSAAWNCLPMVPKVDEFGRKVPVPDQGNAEGKSVSGAVWLSMSSTLGGRGVGVSGLLYTAAAEHKTPMWFLYAPGDFRSKSTAAQCAKALNKSKKGAVGSYVAESAISQADKLAGSALLSPSFKTPQAIVQYLANVAPPRKLGKTPRYTPEAHLWQSPAGLRVVLPNPAFVNFSQYLR
jgi:pimeloyl-ACP methyl ester carboxylesterase